MAIGIATEAYSAVPPKPVVFSSPSTIFCF